MHVSAHTLEQLQQAAQAASRRCYAPYSHFPVGAAVLMGNGEYFTGCNVENASYGLTICAERVAVFQAVAAGHRDIVAVVLYTPTPTPITPCGACRQVISEFNPVASLFCFCDSAQRLDTTLDLLLPRAFHLVQQAGEESNR